jgi:ferrous iron transport protein A
MTAVIQEADADRQRNAEQPEPLSALRAGCRGVILSLEGGHSFRSRVANLGFTIGTEVIVRQNYGHGPVLVVVRGALVALGRREAAQMLVQTGG